MKIRALVSIVFKCSDCMLLCDGDVCKISKMKVDDVASIPDWCELHDPIREDFESKMREMALRQDDIEMRRLKMVAEMDCYSDYDAVCTTAPEGTAYVYQRK